MSSLIRTLRKCAHLALLLSGIASAGDEPAARAAAPPQAVNGGAATTARPARPVIDRWMEVRINGTAMGTPVRLLQRASGELLASAEDFARWRIGVPAGAPLSARGRDYFALDEVAGLSYDIDERTQTLDIRAGANVFAPTVVHARRGAYAPPDVPSAGGFFNYDLQYQQQGGASRTDGLLELGLFNRWGFGTASFLGRDVEGARPLVRLDTAWTRDEPAELRSLRVGDGISRSGSWARSVRFGGVQWGTDFATRPDFIAFPLPTVSGEALLPSTVELYVDNALRLSRGVPHGPFTIPDVPVITGEGQVRVVVRDALGREQVLTQPYYASPGLLQPGLHDYTYEAGFVRRGFGVASNDYGRPFAAGTHRLGVSNRFTAELRGEWQADQLTAGVGGTYLWPKLGVVSAAAAASSSGAGSGGLLFLGMERQARPFSFGFQTQLASARFAQLGFSPDRPPPRQVSVARVSYAAAGIGSFYATHVRQDGRSEPAAEFVSAGYSTALPGNIYVSFFALQSLTGDRARSVGLYLTRSLGSRTTASANWNRQKGDNEPGIQLQQSLPHGPGLGYRVAASGGARPREEAALFLRGDAGTYGLEAARVDGTTGQRLTASGGVALLGGRVHLARRLDESFAVVQVGEYPAVPVYVDNQLVAHTDGGGAALVPSLRPYQKNSISIDQNGLPLDARVGTLRMPVSLPRRSGRVVAFPVRATRGALLRITLEDGAPLPSGAVVRLAGQAGEFPVALRGEAYVTGLTRDNELDAYWKGRSCRIRVAVPPDAGPLPVLGPFVCRGVTP